MILWLLVASGLVVTFGIFGILCNIVNVIRGESEAKEELVTLFLSTTFWAIVWLIGYSLIQKT